jgi:hypothetical protein
MGGRPEGPGLQWRFLGLGTLLLVIGIALISSGTSAIEFEESPMGITKVMVGHQGSVDLAVGPQDQLFAVWEDGRLEAWQGGTAIFFAVSEPISRGRGFSDAIRILDTDVDADQFAPAIDVGPDGVIHVVWQQRSRSDEVTNGPFWEIHYSYSDDGGFSWSDPLRVSQPNNRNNTAPDVAAVTGKSAYVAWEMEDHPGSSVPLAYVQSGYRTWFRENFVPSSTKWELNFDVTLVSDDDGNLHAAWAAKDMDGMWDQIESQVFYLALYEPTGTTTLDLPAPLVDDVSNSSSSHPTLAVTKRHGSWVSWIWSDLNSGADPVHLVLADNMVDDGGGMDIPVLELGPSVTGTPMVASDGSNDEGILLTISNVGSMEEPPLFSSTCSELSCFSEPVMVANVGGPAGLNASIASDSLGNVYVSWDDGMDIWIIQRRNSAPGAPELKTPESYTHDPAPEFTWTFNDPDAGASQSNFEMEYSQDNLFMGTSWGGVVTGALGRSGRYIPATAIDEGKWFWRVRTRDEYGLWSPWSVTGSFLADWTPPSGSIIINGGDDVTQEQVVVLTLNASDNLAVVGRVMYFQVSNDPNFVNASTYEFPPPNQQVNHRLTDGEGVKVVFFRILDATELEQTSVDTIIYNMTPMAIAHTPILTAPADKALTVRCDINRFEGVITSLFYREEGDKDYKEIEMESNGTMFWAEIPRKDVDLSGLEYYIKARSSKGLVTSPKETPADTPHVVEVFETTDEYRPPIYSPEITLAGAAAIGVLLFSVWYFRIRESS